MATAHSNPANPLDVWCVLPAYNCSGTVVDTATQCRAYMPHVLVVDDGSSDANLQELFAHTGIPVLRHPQNRGKGAALHTALRYIRDQAGSHLLTLDADGQHLPADLPVILKQIEKHQDAIVIGCRNFDTAHVPGSSKFGRSFSNLWVRLETGTSLNDTQSGFRAYPVRHISRLALRSHHYNFEIEVLTRGIWAGIKIIEVPVRVVYPPPDQRISHFRPFVDNLRLSLLHARLVGRRLVPWPHTKVIPSPTALSALQFLRHPVQCLKLLLREHATPSGLAASAAIGTILAVLPLVGFHSLSILYACTRLHLNKVMALSIQNLYAIPIVPFACIELGYFMRHRTWWTDFSRETVFEHVHLRLYEWLLGSLVLAPIFALLAAFVTFVVARTVQRRVLQSTHGSTG